VKLAYENNKQQQVTNRSRKNGLILSTGWVQKKARIKVLILLSLKRFYIIT